MQHQILSFFLHDTQTNCDVGEHQLDITTRSGHRRELTRETIRATAESESRYRIVTH